MLLLSQSAFVGLVRESASSDLTFSSPSSPGPAPGMGWERNVSLGLIGNLVHQPVILIWLALDGSPKREAAFLVAFVREFTCKSSLPIADRDWFLSPCVTLASHFTSLRLSFPIWKIYIQFTYLARML